MAANIKCTTNSGVKYSGRIHHDGQEQQHSEVEVLDNGEQHPDPGLQEADEHTQKKLPAVKRSCFRCFEVNLGVLYLLFLAGVMTRYILVTLEKEQLQTRNNKLSNNNSQPEGKPFVNISQLQCSSDVPSKNQSQPQAKLLENNSQLQEEVKQQKDKTESVKERNPEYGTRKSPEEWMRFEGRSYFKSTERKTWDESRNDCQGRGADLVIINSKEEQKFINELNGRGEFWIGLEVLKKRISRWVSRWEWKWVDGSTPGETFWAPGQQDPDSYYYGVCCDDLGKWRKSYSAPKTWICEK